MRQTDRVEQRQTHRDKGRQTQTGTDRERHTDRQIDRDGQTEADRQRQTNKYRVGQIQTMTDRIRHRKTQKWRLRETDRDTDLREAKGLELQLVTFLPTGERRIHRPAREVSAGLGQGIHLSTVDLERSKPGPAPVANKEGAGKGTRAAEFGGRVIERQPLNLKRDSIGCSSVSVTVVVELTLFYVAPFQLWYVYSGLILRHSRNSLESSLSIFWERWCKY